jgi:hypothetical protein
MAKAPVFNKKTGELTFFFRVAQAGKFKWALFFKNSDVGFADALGAELRGALAPALAETAKKKKKCKKGFTKHRGKCVHVLVPFGSGAKNVAAGLVKIKVRPSAKALKALKRGRTLHVSGRFRFQSALGGSPVAHTVSVVVHKPKKHKKKHH